MNNTPDFAPLLRRTLAALLLCAVLVTICYWFIDRPVAFFVYHHKFSDYAVLKWLTYPPPILQSWAPLALAALAVRRAYGPFRRCEITLLAACVSLILADQFRISLEYIFGRYWPETWINDNPSLIGNAAYGFHLFHGGTAYGSFPSGHSARTTAIASVIWIACPKWRWACVLAFAAEAIGLLGMNYHFVGDIIGGAFLGAIVGAYTAQFAGLAPRNPPPPDTATWSYSVL